MKNKSILVIFLIFLSLLTVNVVCAETDDVTTEGNIVTVHGVKFNIPEGYEVSDINKSENQTDCYLIKDTDVVLISVYYDEEYDEVIEINGFKNKTIKNYNGVFSSNDKTVQFEYISDHKQVFLTASNEDVINKILI